MEAVHEHPRPVCANIALAAGVSVCVFYFTPVGWFIFGWWALWAALVASLISLMFSIASVSRRERKTWAALIGFALSFAVPAYIGFVAK